jgi:peptidoglycan/LPS O-acetylase OafA/YrhL
MTEDAFIPSLQRRAAADAGLPRHKAGRGIAAAAGQPASDRNLAIGYLRAFVTVLVLAHHSVIAYIAGLPKPSASFTTPPFLWSAFPIQDPHNGTAFSLLTGFNETFFMSLMFFISGLFVWDSLKRKGAGGFVRDRIVRLGLPFAVAAGVLAPLAYYPSYRLTGADPGLAAYWRAWTSLPAWMSGPAWFVWVLLAFGCLAAGVYKLAPRWGEALGGLTASAMARPLAVFARLLAVSAVAYIPLALIFGVTDWLQFGPFSIQASRILHYALYFTTGIGVGAIGLGNGLLARDGALQQRWRRWAIAAPIVFVVVAALTIASYALKGADQPGWEIVNGLAYVLCCATASFAFMAVVVHFATGRSAIWDSLAANAYGMYLVHYVFVTWIQFTLLPSNLPGLSKGVLVFASVLALSWGSTALLRRIPVVARIL